FHAGRPLGGRQPERKQTQQGELRTYGCPTRAWPLVLPLRQIASRKFAKQQDVNVAATRPAIRSFAGQYASVPARQRGATVTRALLERTGVGAGSVDEVIMGQVLTAGCGQNPARQAAVHGGLPHSVPALTINKVCGSGLKAVQMAAQ